MCSKILEYTEKALEGTSYLSSKILQEVVFAFEILLVLCLSCYNEIELLKKPLWLGNAHTPIVHRSGSFHICLALFGLSFLSGATGQLCSWYLILEKGNLWLVLVFLCNPHFQFLVQHFSSLEFNKYSKI